MSFRAPLLDAVMILAPCFAVAVLLTTVLRAAAQTEDHPYTGEQILAGSKLYSANCQFCHGPNGDGIGGVNLAHQQFKRAVTDDDIRNTIHNGVPDAGMPAFGAITAEEQYDLVAFIRSGFDKSGTPLRLGDKDKGKAVYVAFNCESCHQPRGDGPHNAPSLLTIGSQRIPADMVRVILDPNKSMYPINRPVTIVTREGKTYRGRRLNEDTYSVQLVDENHRLVSILKSDIRNFEKSSKSAMPAYAGKISESELSDLMAYLVSLKG
jgi:putative heme-binding domain-containing protein